MWRSKGHQILICESLEKVAMSMKGRRFETLDELTQALNAALDYWNAHCHPYYWRKKPQDQVTILGGFGLSQKPIISTS